MKMMHTMASEANAAAPKRRLYSPELKNQVVAQARLPGASIAGVALSHGINANIVHRWLRERAGQPPQAPSGFVALSLPTAHGKLEEESAKLAQDIRIELRRGATVVNVAWPVAQAGECAAWMRELLR
ncbi:MAG: transposase [Ramlibacter sp.]|jgi:transposase|nr:transposase [Pseudomonadota bacterium]MCW5648232.1 transposase [Ramlibacter sp.]